MLLMLRKNEGELVMDGDVMMARAARSRAGVDLLIGIALIGYF